MLQGSLLHAPGQHESCSEDACFILQACFIHAPGELDSWSGVGFIRVLGWLESCSGQA